MLRIGVRLTDVCRDTEMGLQEIVMVGWCVADGLFEFVEASWIFEDNVRILRESRSGEDQQSKSFLKLPTMLKHPQTKISARCVGSRGPAMSTFTLLHVTSSDEIVHMAGPHISLLYCSESVKLTSGSRLANDCPLRRQAFEIFVG